MNSRELRRLLSLRITAFKYHNHSLLINSPKRYLSTISSVQSPSLLSKSNCTIYNSLKSRSSTSFERKLCLTSAASFNLVQPEQSSRAMRPEGVDVNWDFSILKPEDIESKCTEICGHMQKLYDSVANSNELTRQAILDPILESHLYSQEELFVSIVKYVCDDQKLRDASSAASKTLGEFSVEMSMRKDVHDKLVEYSKVAEKDNLNSEEKRVLERLIRDGKRNGLDLSDDQREKIMAIKKEISNLALKFNQNLNEEKTSVLLSESELEGMSKLFLEGLTKDEETGKYKVTLKYPDYFPITRQCTVPETRKKMETLFYSRCQEENTQLLEDILELRQKEAELLGYQNHAHYMMEVLMAKTSKAVNEFLADLGEKIMPLWERDRKMMLDLKKKECEKYNYPFNGTLDIWDYKYYVRMIEEEFFAVNQEAIKAYFPVDVVTKGMMGIYEELLGLKFFHIPDAEKWHKNVDCYKVEDAHTKEILGYIYLDLFPREGKYGHACMYPMRYGLLDEGVKKPSIAAMIANFSSPQSDKPSLLDHKELETYFHEFGHCMHMICSKAKTAFYFGCQVERDFVEAPSQMLENWVWEKEPLKRMSSHYQTKEPIPDELIEKLAASRNATEGAFIIRQIILATFDQMAYTNGRINTAEVYAKLQKEKIGIESIPGTNFVAGFAHIASGYSARYYSYLWSQVYSTDMYYTKFKANGIFDRETGSLYRRSILEPGGSKDAMDMLADFLGRPPNNIAFLESKGLSA